MVSIPSFLAAKEFPQSKVAVSISNVPETALLTSIHIYWYTFAFVFLHSIPSINIKMTPFGVIRKDALSCSFSDLAENMGLMRIAPQSAVLRLPFRSAWTAHCVTVHRTGTLHVRALSASSPSILFPVQKMKWTPFRRHFISGKVQRIWYNIFSSKFQVKKWTLHYRKVHHFLQFL